MADEEEVVGPSIIIDPEHMAGVWANYARVSHSPYEFTLDFVRLDFTQKPLQGIVVGRVSVSPLMITQLIEALNENWDRYANKAMPPEVREHGKPNDDADDGQQPPSSPA